MSSYQSLQSNMVDPLKYSQTDNSTHFGTKHIIDEFEEEIIHMSGKCMDIGCGPGDVTRHLLLPALDPKAVVVGTDISENMIRHAKELHGDEERLKFEVLDIQTKHLPEKYLSEYDHAFTFHVLHWSNDIRQVFENIYRLLRPGGTVLALTVISCDSFHIFHEMSQDVRYASYIKNVKNLVSPFYDLVEPRKELKVLLRSIGFNILHCSQRERTYSVEEVHLLPPRLLSFATQFLGNMPHVLMEQFKDEYTRESMKRKFFQKQMFNKNERIVSDVHEILVVYAQKDNNV